MKRSEHVSLAMMGVAAFAATFASATLYMAKPGASQSAQSWREKHGPVGTPDEQEAATAAHRPKV